MHSQLYIQIGDVQITEGTLKPQESHIPNRSSGLTWFDDSPIQPTTHPFVEELTRFEIPEENPSQSIRVPRMDDPPIRGSRLIGEAPITVGEIFTSCTKIDIPELI